MIDRSPNGRFAPGSCGGPGRPTATREASYRDSLRRVVTLERWERVIERALRDAEGGDAKARAFLAAYILGPTAPVIVEPLAHQSELSREEKAAYVIEEIRKAKLSSDKINEQK